MKLRNNAGLTLTIFVINMLIVVAIFTGAFTFLGANIESANLTLSDNYSTTNDNFLEVASAIDNKTDDIKNNLNNIVEAENVAQVAWNGLKGLGNTLLLPVTFITEGVNLITYSNNALTGVVPGWVLTLGVTAFLVLIVLLILGSLKGESKI